VIEKGESLSSHRLHGPIAIEMIVGLVREDVKGGLAVLQINLHPPGGMGIVPLYSSRVHAPRLHRCQHLLTGLVGTHPGDHERPQSERLEVPGDVERCTAENAGAVGHHVEQHLADDQRSS
jgi:hypothetical protein